MMADSESFEDRSPQPAGRQRRLIIRLSIRGCVVGTAIALLAVTIHYRRIERSAERKIERLMEARNKLRATAERLERGETQGRLDSKLILGVLDQCRTAEDIPEFGGDRIAVQQQDGEHVLFYVPKGSHQLEIVAAWRPAESARVSNDGESVAGELADAAQESGEKRWRIPLLPESGYQMKVICGRGAGHVQWKLTSDNPEFSARHEFLPLEEFDRDGFSWRGRGAFIAFPNQVQPHAIRSIEQLFSADAGLELTTFTLRGDVRDRPYEIAWTQTLVSAGPVNVAASDVGYVLARARGDVLLSYRGSGRYQLKSVKSSRSASK